MVNLEEAELVIMMKSKKRQQKENELGYEGIRELGEALKNNNVLMILNLQRERDVNQNHIYMMYE